MEDQILHCSIGMACRLYHCSMTVLHEMCRLILSGEQMRVASGEFASDPCSSMKRGAMVRAARALLSSVTRLLIIADMVDVHLMLKSLRIVRSFVHSYIRTRFEKLAKLYEPETVELILAR